MTSLWPGVNMIIFLHPSFVKLNIGIHSHLAASNENPATAKEKSQTKKLAVPESFLSQNFT